MHRTLATELGALTLVGDGDALTGVFFEDHRPAPRGDRGPEAPDGLAAAAGELLEYLDGRRTAFSVGAAPPEGTSPLRRAVWARIAAIPYGRTCSYRELAAELGAHPRAVGGAVAHNPLSIVVPCHRVIGADGALTGYAGGLARKRALLALEARVLGGG